MSLENKTIVVAGAGGGMGKEIVRQLLAENANVVGCDINVESLSEFKEESNFLDLQGDLLDENVVKDIFDQTNNKFDGIDGLVNAAGIAQRSIPIDQISLDNWFKIMDINMTMAFLTCREAAIYMKEMNAGSIVNIGSVSTTRPRPGLQSYVASKGAVESFSKALALELAPNKINVNVLHPGPCDTNMLGQFAKEGANIDEVKDSVFKQSVPLGDLLTPRDIANSVKFLLSDDSKMITGTVFHVDGGRSV